MLSVISLVGGLVGLFVAGQFVVDGASTIGRHFGLTPMVVGLTIVAAGTSAPELAVVLQSVAADDTELAVGSVIGSNIANVLLVLGLAATFATIHVTSRAVRVDIPIMIGASALLLVMALDGVIERLDGIVLFTVLVCFVVWTLRSAPRLNGESADVEDPDRSPESPCQERVQSIGRLVPQLIFGIGGLAIAARFVVSGAEEIATSLGIPELIVGLTIVALGTSAPEIVTTLVAAWSGNRDLAVGNAVGSNIFNILLVFGLSTIVAPDGIPISTDALELDIPVLLAAALACLPFVFWDHKLDRWEGGVFVGYYFAYVVFLVLDGTGHRASDPFAFVMLAFVVPLTALTLAVAVVRHRRHALTTVTRTSDRSSVDRMESLE